MKKILLIIIIFFCFPFAVSAAFTCTGADPGCVTATSKRECDAHGGGCSWTDSSGTIGAPLTPVSLINPLTGRATSKSPEVLVGNIINAVMGVVGSLALAMFIYGGFTWMLAAGNDQRVQKGKEILIWATVGLIVIFSSYAIVRLVFTGIGLT